MYFEKIFDDLLKDNQKALVRSLLDFYFPKTTTTEELDVLGRVCVECCYPQMQVKIAERMFLDAQHKSIPLNNLVEAYIKNNQPHKAQEYNEQHINLDGWSYEKMIRKAKIHSMMGEKQFSDELFEDMLNQFPDKSEEIHCMLAPKYFRDGNVVRGILHFLYKEKDDHAIYFNKILGMKHWDGGEINGKTLVINASGGHGDIFIFSRFIKKIKELGGRPLLYLTNDYFSESKNILNRIGIETIHNENQFHKDYLWTEFMKLPAYLGLSESELWDGSFIEPLRNPKNDLPKTDKIRIGIKCQGNPDFAQDIYRSIDLNKMIDHLDYDNVELYYIDKKNPNNCNVIDTSDMIESWEDTLDIIDQMDYIISSCTSLVHAAASMGKKTMVFTPIQEYFIWTSTYPREKEFTPWYGDHVKVLKQTEVAKWDNQLLRMKEILENEFGTLQNV